MKRATKKETETRVAHAAELVLEGQAYSAVTSLVAEKYNISRRRARQIASNAYLLIKDDVEEGDLNRPEMTAKLIAILESAMYLAMKKGQYNAVAANAFKSSFFSSISLKYSKLQFINLSSSLKSVIFTLLFPSTNTFTVPSGNFNSCKILLSHPYEKMSFFFGSSTSEFF